MFEDPAQPNAEPVAWRYLVRGIWSVTNINGAADFWQSEGCVVEPLYTASAIAQSDAELVCPRCGGRGPHMHPKTPWEGRLDFDTPDNNFERHLQPVAWRYAYPDYPGHWNVTLDKLTADERRGNAGCIVEPLYTAPPRPDTSAGLIEAAEIVKDWSQACVKDSEANLLDKLEKELRARARAADRIGK